MIWFILCAATILLLDVAAVYVFRKACYWQNEGAKLLNIGYVPPPVTAKARLLRRCFGRYSTFRHVGPVLVVNGEYLSRPGRYLIVLNHQIEKDALLVMHVLGLHNYRYLIASNQVLGTRIPLAAMTGALVVDHANNPGASVRSAIRALASEPDSSLVVFPQGTLVRRNVLTRKEFAAGVLMIGKHAHKKSELPFFVLPAAIDYDRNPAHASLLHKALHAIGWQAFRRWWNEQTYRATVVLGEPIPMEKLPANLDLGMDIVFGKICQLAAQAKDLNDNGWSKSKLTGSKATT
jgi:1-acyl-sn-glycerol-3-phosphate acyltransferase